MTNFEVTMKNMSVLHEVGGDMLGPLKAAAKACFEVRTRLKKSNRAPAIH